MQKLIVLSDSKHLLLKICGLGSTASNIVVRKPGGYPRQRSLVQNISHMLNAMPAAPVI